MTTEGLQPIARLMAEVHAEIHSRKAPELPSFRETLVNRIESLSLLSRDTKISVLELPARLPDGED